MQVCVLTCGLTGVRLRAFAGAPSAVVAFGRWAGVGDRTSFRRTPSRVTSSFELVEILEVVLGDPDRSSDADARDGAPGHELVELRGTRAEALSGLRDGQQRDWGSGGRSRHGGLLDRQGAGAGAGVSWGPGALTCPRVARGWLTTVRRRDPGVAGVAHTGSARALDGSLRAGGERPVRTTPETPLDQSQSANQSAKLAAEPVDDAGSRRTRTDERST